MIFRSTLSWQFHEMSPVVLRTELPTRNSEGPLNRTRRRVPYNVVWTCTVKQYATISDDITCADESFEVRRRVALPDPLIYADWV